MSEDEAVGNINNDLEIILDGDEVEYTEEQSGEVNGEENQESAAGQTRKEVKQKRIVKNPQPKLNEQTLKGPKGLAAIESYFEKVKFKGRGYEEQDLNILLKIYEYWCHRLFPKFPFDSCIARLEKLGTKRATQTQLKRIRMGLNFDEIQNTILNDEELNVTEGFVDNVTEGFVDTYNDQFDQIMSTTLVTDPESEFNEGQLERIRQNKERAKRLRKDKLRKLQETIQNSEVQNQMDAHDTESFSSVASDHNGQSGISDLQDSDRMQTEDNDGNEVGGNEDDIENILDYINTDENPANAKESSIRENSTTCQNQDDEENSKTGSNF
uniref:TIMELESS-interacting protein n=1 Tax=Anoplophora glabripennis TaxID=217634 RepID=V5G6U4_ANOGL